MIFGIRPEHIHDPQFTPRDIVEAPAEGRVEVTELMGNETYPNVLVSGKPFIARVDPRTNARVGQRIRLSFDMGHAKLFDRETEQAVR